MSTKEGCLHNHSKETGNAVRRLGGYEWKRGEERGAWKGKGTEGDQGTTTFVVAVVRVSSGTRRELEAMENIIKGAVLILMMMIADDGKPLTMIPFRVPWSHQSPFTIIMMARTVAGFVVVAGWGRTMETTAKGLL